MTRSIIFSTLLILLAACGQQKTENSYHVEFSAPDYLLEHEKYLEEELIQIGSHKVWDYNTPNKGFGNSIMVEGDDGIIIIDTTSSSDHAEVAHTAFREITDKPVKAIIYTHHHADHINGAAQFVNSDDVSNGRVNIIAAQNFMREMSDENQATAPIMGIRAMYMYGQLLNPEQEGRHYHIACCGHELAGGKSGYIAPNTFVDGDYEITIAGVKLRIFLTGGESASHLAVYLPEQKILFSGDEIQGPTYPNLHSLRGTKPRDAEKWINAIDKMRALDVEYLVPSHGRPVVGKTESNKVLTLYRDVIQFTHDQSVRYINKGYTPDELANTISMPDFLDIDPWTKEMYGTIKHNVREYYVAYISWWNGDPADLDPTPRVEKAKRYILLMGGRDAVFKQAEQAFFAKDYQWSSELATLLIRVDKQDMPARYLKAGALRAIGYATANTNWRGFYLSSALELEGKINPGEVLNQLANESFKPEQMTVMQLFNNLRFYVNAEEIGDLRLKVAFHINDTGEKYTLEVRNSILEIHQSALADSDLTLYLDRSTLNKTFSKQLTYAYGIASGDIKLEGSKLALLKYAKVFDAARPAPFITLR